MTLFVYLQVEVSVSHELALSVLSEQQQQKLEHIVKAFDIILQSEKNNVTDPDKTHFPLIKYLTILDGKSWTDSASLFSKNESAISKSLGAYLCHSIVQWFLKNDLLESETAECEGFIAAVIEKHLENLLDKDSVSFWTTTNTINKLESQLSLSIGKLNKNIIYFYFH